jgi:rhomboid protease GluP
MLLAVVGFVAYRVTSPEQREHVFAIAIEYLRHLKIVVAEPGPEYEAFRDALRARTLHLIAIPAIVLVSVQLFLAMRFGSTATSEPAMLVGWGASLGTLTTNGGWWRLVTSTFVYSSTLHLVLSLAALIQVGRILERVVGRLTVVAVYLSAASLPDWSTSRRIRSP